MGMGTKIVKMGWGWGHILRGRGRDGDTAGGDGAGTGANPVGEGLRMGIGTTGTVGDGDKFLSPCSSLILIMFSLSIAQMLTVERSLLFYYYYY